MTVTIDDQSMGSPSGGAHPAGAILGKRPALQAWLDLITTPLHKCAGLTADQLKERAVPPSRLSQPGLVQHMTEVERW